MTHTDCSNSCMITQMLLARSVNKVDDPEQIHFATRIENRKDDSHKQPACAHRDSWNVKLLHTPCAVPLIVRETCQDEPLSDHSSELWDHSSELQIWNSHLCRPQSLKAPFRREGVGRRGGGRRRSKKRQVASDGVISHASPRRQ